MATETPQPPSAGLIGLLAWIEVHKKQVAYGAGAVIVLIAVVSAVIQHQIRKEITASQVLSEVRLSYNPALPSPPGTAEALMSVANNYRGTKAAARALLVSASVLFADKNYTEAQQRYAQLIRDYPTSPWVAEAHLGIGTVLDVQGKTNEAIAKFEEVRKRYATSGAAEEAKLALARLYEGPRPEEAFNLYNDLTKANPGSSLAAEAEFRQEDLLKKHPELAKLKEPIVSPTPQQPILLTNRPPAATNPAMMMSNIIRRTNFQQMMLTNRPGTTGAPVQLNIPPGGTPPAAAPPPAPAPVPVPAK